MSHIRTHIALRILPVSMVAGGADSVARGKLDRFCSPTSRYNTATPRHHFGGIAAQN